MGEPKMVISDIGYGPFILWPPFTAAHEEISRFYTGEYVENQRKQKKKKDFILPSVINI